MTVYRYAPTDTIGEMWDKFALNLTAIHKREAQQELLTLSKLDTPGADLYMNELFPFNAHAYLKNIRDRFNNTIIPTAGSEHFWANTNLTSQYIYLERRKHARSLIYLTDKILTELTSYAGVPRDWKRIIYNNPDTQQAQQTLTLAGERIGIESNFATKISSLYFLTEQRKQLTTTAMTTPPLPVEFSTLLGDFEDELIRL